jgi:hypothetical protein
VKILIHAYNQKINIESQAEILCAELEKMGHSVEWSNQTHPARLFLNKYDVIHILTESMPLSWKNFWIVAAAKALALPVVVTSYAVQILSEPFATVANMQLGYFDAMSVPEAYEIKNLRSFNQSKFILPAFTYTQKLMTQKKSDETNVIFHLENNFEELPAHKWILQNNVFINATQLSKNKTQAQIRKSWTAFLKKNSTYQNAILISNENNLLKLMRESRCLFLVNYLKIHSVNLANIIENCIAHKTVLVLNEGQASGSPQIWTDNKNGLIQNFEKSFLYQLSFTEVVEKAQNFRFEKIESSFYESKLNELSRLYVKIKNQKDLKISYANMPRRS